MTDKELENIIKSIHNSIDSMMKAKPDDWRSREKIAHIFMEKHEAYMNEFVKRYNLIMKLVKEKQNE